MIKVVVFDLDDTLISEKEYIKSGFYVISKKIIKDYELNMSYEEICKKMLNMLEDSSKNVFNRILEYYKLKYTEDYIKELVKLYREHMPTIHFYDDVIKCINDLKEKDIKIGIISDGYLTTQRNKLNVLNGDMIFDKIILTDEFGRVYWKPNPKAFELIKEYFSVNYDEMIYVGDNPMKDFYINKLYPINTVRIYRENTVYSNAEYLEGIKEKFQIKSLKELIDIINSINEKN